MNWEAMAAIAELSGALAVVISLVYLASQVRSGTRTLRTTTRDSSFVSLMDFNHAVMSDPDLAYIFQVGCHDYDALEERERARLVHVFYSFFKMFEKIYLHFLDGSVDESVWVHNKPMLLAYATQPGAKYYLSMREKIFDPRYWELLHGATSSETPAGHILSKLNVDK